MAAVGEDSLKQDSSKQTRKSLFEGEGRVEVSKWEPVFGGDEESLLKVEVGLDGCSKSLVMRIIRLKDGKKWMAIIPDGLLKSFHIPLNMPVHHQTKKLIAVMQRGEINVVNDSKHEMNVDLSSFDEDLSMKLNYESLVLESVPMTDGDTIRYLKNKLSDMLEEREKNEILLCEKDEKMDELKKRVTELTEALQMVSEERDLFRQQWEELQTQNQVMTDEMIARSSAMSDTSSNHVNQKLSDLTDRLRDRLASMTGPSANPSVPNLSLDGQVLPIDALEIMGEVSLKQMIKDDYPDKLDALAKHYRWDVNDERDWEGNPVYLAKLAQCNITPDLNPLEILHAKWLFIHRSGVTERDTYKEKSALELCSLSKKLYSMLQWFLKEGSIDPMDGQSGALFAAAWSGNDLATRILLADPRVSINRPNILGMTPLMKAAENGHTAVVSLLLKHGCDTDRSNSEGLTALDIALQNGQHEIAAYLESMGAPRGRFA